MTMNSSLSKFDNNFLTHLIIFLKNANVEQREGMKVYFL